MVYLKSENTKVSKIIKDQTSVEVDFTHMMATLDMYDTKNSTKAILGGWGGDLAQLIKHLVNSGKSGTELTAEANSKMAAATGSTFGLADYNSDIDASNIYKKYLYDNTIALSEAIASYYSQYKTTKNRVALFIQNEFGSSATSVEALSDVIENIMTDNYLIDAWFTSNGVNKTTHAAQITAACDAFAKKLLTDAGILTA